MPTPEVPVYAAIALLFLKTVRDIIKERRDKRQVIEVVKSNGGNPGNPGNKGSSTNLVVHMLEENSEQLKTLKEENSGQFKILNEDVTTLKIKVAEINTRCKTLHKTL